MRKVDIRVKRTYKQLAEALMRLLAKKSFDDLTVLEICEEASVHRATFYKHFVDKYDFLNACFKMKLSELTFDKAEEKYTSETMEKSCMDMIIRVLNLVEQNRTLLIYLSSDNQSASFSTALSDSIAAFLEERINTIRPTSERLDKFVPMLANYYAGAIVGLVKWWVNTDVYCTKQDILDFAEVKINDFSNYFDMFI